MVKKIKWVGTLSTTERNHIGLIKVRQNNANSEVLGFNIADGNGEPYDLKNRKVLFCTYFDKFAPVEQYAEVIENGKIIYTMNEHDMQKPVRINFAYFRIEDENGNLVDATQNFSYDIMPSIESKCMNSEPYIIRLEEVLDAFLQINTDAKKELEQIIIDFNKQIIEQQQDFEFWFEAIKDILESIDPGGIILNEIIKARDTEIDLNARLERDKRYLKEQIELTQKESIKNNSHISSNIKMTMHFNFTDEKEVQENLEILKSLGYNTLHIQRNNTALTDVTGVATNKLLKQFRENGFGAILHVDYDTLISDDFSDVEKWIKTIDHNTNIVGYWHADEPFYRELPAEETELAYNRLKELTDKPIYVIDPGRKLSTYTKCFDVFVWNIYPNTKKYKGLTPQQLKYAWLYDYVNLFRSERYAAKNVMVMFPTIKHLEINEDAPTIEEIDTLIEFYKHVGVLSENISTFMYHFYDDGKFEDLKSSEYLRYLSNKILQEGTVSNPQKIYTITAKQLQSSQAFVSTNLDYNDKYDSVILKNGGKHAEVVLKISKSGFYNNNELYDYVTFHNNGDNKLKQLEISISYDSVNYTAVHVYNFNPTWLDNYPKNISEKPVIKINNTADSVFVRFRIFNEDGTSMTSSEGQGVGFKHIQLAFL